MPHAIFSDNVDQTIVLNSMLVCWSTFSPLKKETFRNQRRNLVCQAVPGQTNTLFKTKILRPNGSSHNDSQQVTQQVGKVVTNRCWSEKSRSGQDFSDQHLLVTTLAPSSLSPTSGQKIGLPRPNPRKFTRFSASWSFENPIWFELWPKSPGEKGTSRPTQR